MFPRKNSHIICIRQLLYERRMWSTGCAYDTFLKKCSLKSLLSITIANEAKYQTKDVNDNDERHNTLGVKYQSVIFNIWYKRCHKQDNNEYKYTPTDTKVCKFPFGPPLIHCSIIIVRAGNETVGLNLTWAHNLFIGWALGFPTLDRSRNRNSK